MSSPSASSSARTSSAGASAGAGTSLRLTSIASPPRLTVRRLRAKSTMDTLRVSAARRRAEFGVERPVFRHGAEVGTVTEHSDNLAMFLLKGRRPEVFKEHRSGPARTQESLIPRARR